MGSLAQRIEAREPLLVDGAMGTMLMMRGLTPGDCPESINLSTPEYLGEIAGEYLAAGADILETNTFGASPLALARYGLENRMEAINEAAVRVARAVAGPRAGVAGSCGPSGKLPEPYGDAEPEALLAGYQRQIACLVGAGVDAIFVETMMDLTEATLAVRAAKEVAPTMPVIATMTFDPTPRGYHTIMGVTVEQAAAGLREAGADAIGSNCGHGIGTMVEIARAFRACTDLPVVIQSNAGLPDPNLGPPVYPDTPEYMAARVEDLLAAGVSIIGGCCGTTPAHIRAFRGALDKYREKSGAR